MHTIASHTPAFLVQHNTSKGLGPRPNGLGHVRRVACECFGFDVKRFDPLVATCQSDNYRRFALAWRINKIREAAPTVWRSKIKCCADRKMKIPEGCAIPCAKPEIKEVSARHVKSGESLDKTSASGHVRASDLPGCCQKMLRASKTMRNPSNPSKCSFRQPCAKAMSKALDIYY